MSTATETLVAGEIKPRRIRREFLRKASVTFILFFVYLLAAGASFSAFYEKWELRDGDEKFGLAAMVEGTGARPYVYRQLVPVMANRLEGAIPPDLRGTLAHRFVVSDGSLEISGAEARDPAYALRYAIIYYATFLAAFLAIVTLQRVAARFYSPTAASMGAVGLVVAYPYFMSMGGYFYDYFELLFFALAVQAAMSGRLVLLAAITALGVANKESFLFFLPALYPFLRMAQPVVPALAGLGACAALGGALTLAIHWYYHDNPGVTGYLQLTANLAAAVDPRNLFALDRTYGLPLPAASSLLGLAFLFAVGRYGWPRLPDPGRRHLVIAAAINVPLFAAMCTWGEMRNLSLIAIGLFLLICAAFEPRQDHPVAG